MQDYSSHVLKSRGVVRLHLSALVLAVTALVSPALAMAADTPVACPVSCTGVTGNVNDYWPGTANSSNSGTTSGGTSGVGVVTLGTKRTGAVAGNSLSKGDWVLIIQMQDADIDITNTANYGWGGSVAAAGAGSAGRGYKDARNAGFYEFARVDSFNSSTGLLTLTNALTKSYFYQEQADGTNATKKMRRSYQVVRVPYCTSMTLASGPGQISGPAWDGNTGGVIALHSKTLDFGGATINATGLGFRGGATDPHNFPWQTDNWTSYKGVNSGELDQFKAEGIAGTPDYVFDITTNQERTFTGQGITLRPFPGGYRARGAPANAGGGGTGDAGAGGGANGGAGGQGGQYTNDSPITFGGLGGVAFAQRAYNRVVMGGGGGGGAAGPNSNDNQTLPVGPPNTTYYSRGGSGGGIVLIGATTRTGTVLIKSNGNDASGSDIAVNAAGGAGGSVVLYGADAAPVSFSIEAKGGAGTNNSAYGTPDHTNAVGGGGGGGVIFGASGTVTRGTWYNQGGSTAAGDGFTSGAFSNAPPGNASCPILADLYITKTNTPTINNDIDQSTDVVVSGVQTTYTITVTNKGPDGANGAKVTDTVGSGLTAANCSVKAGSCTASNNAACPVEGTATGQLSFANLTNLGVNGGVVIPTLPGSSTAPGTVSFKVVCTVN